jgi:type VI secretion system FHA domain protein
MPLGLMMLRCPDSVRLQSRSVDGDGEFSIGRGPENDWVLPDPERYLSKRHCILSLHSGTWRVVDHSTNGTFLNGDSAPIGRGHTRDLSHGDRLHLGTYEFEVRLDDEAVLPPNPTMLNAAAAAPDALCDTKPRQDQIGGTRVPLAGGLPADYDPMAPDPALDGLGAVQGSPAMLPEDWDAPATAEHPEKHAHHGHPHPARHSRATHAGHGAAASDGELLAAFLRGAQLGDTVSAVPPATMEALGAALREMVRGLRQLITARAAIKATFNIDQTAIRTRGNNPLKFAVTDDDALAALFGKGRRTDMGAADAVGEVLGDIRLHELASLTATEAAVLRMFAELDPEKLRGSIDEGGFNILSLQRKARAWDAFETEHARISQALLEGFGSEFGKCFAQAYETALAEASAKEPHR